MLCGSFRTKDERAALKVLLCAVCCYRGVALTTTGITTHMYCDNNKCRTYTLHPTCIVCSKY